MFRSSRAMQGRCCGCRDKKKNKVPFKKDNNFVTQVNKYVKDNSFKESNKNFKEKVKVPAE